MTLSNSPDLSVPESSQATKTQEDLRTLYELFLDAFYRNQADSLEAYETFAEAMTKAGYNPMAFHEDGAFIPLD